MLLVHVCELGYDITRYMHAINVQILMVFFPSNLTFGFVDHNKDYFWLKNWFGHVANNILHMSKHIFLWHSEMKSL